MDSKFYKLQNLIYCFITVLFLLFSSKLSAGSSFVLTSDMKGELIGKNLFILEDRNKEYNINDVITKDISKRFSQCNDASPGFGYTDSAYWVRFNIKNDENTNIKWLLEISYPLLDKISIFLPDKKGSFIEKKAGDHKPFYQREIKYRNFVFPIKTESGSIETLFMRFESSSSMNLPINIWSPQYFYEFMSDEQIVLGIYVGIMLVMILYNFFIYLSVRGNAYLYVPLQFFIFL